MPNDDVADQLRALGLRSSPREALLALLAHATKHRLSPVQVCEALVALERRARDLRNLVGAPAPPSMHMRDVPSDLRPMAAALLAHHIPVIDAGRDKGTAWLRVAAQDVQEVRWLGDALSRIDSQLGEKRSDAVLALGQILWEQQDRSIPKRCLGWQEIRVELEDTASQRCLRKVDLADATQAALDEEGSVPFG